MSEQITDQMRDRIQAILVADGVQDGKAYDEANSLCDGLGYYHRVTASTGLHFARVYDGIEVQGNGGDFIELIPFERTEEMW